MRKLKVGINGFGRIGRAVARHLLQSDKHEITHINDINPDRANLKYLLQYDTTYGRLELDSQVTESGLTVGSHNIRVTHHPEIDKVPWIESGCDVVIESTGVKNNETHARGLTNKLHVLVTQMAGQSDFTLVFGVNEDQFDPKTHKLVSTSICDANACAPVLKVIKDSFGINHGFVTTLHPWLSYQNLMDGPSRSQSYPGATYSHYALGRSSIGNIIPKPTTVVSACERVLPDLKSRLQCFSYRVPTSIVSTADLTLDLERDVTLESLTQAFKKQIEKSPFKTMRLCDEPLTSVDYIRDEHSSIIDLRWVMINNARSLKLVLWYDNEWGYSARVVDTLDLISRGNH
ncbi:MAG: aldehyde dehydrogenase [Oligoflexia bacterium]|nr:aldehyde dehydrogenase [Oligoflexia bacterium]